MKLEFVSLTFVLVTSVTLTLSENFGSIQYALMLSWCFSILYFCVGGQKSTVGGSPSFAMIEACKKSLN